MARIRIFGLPGRKEHKATNPSLGGGSTVAPPNPCAPPKPGVREVRTYAIRPGGERDVLSGSLPWLAALVITGALAGVAYVAYDSQRLLPLAHNHGVRAALIGALPDAGWSSMTLVALVAALRGQSSAKARLAVLIFFAVSLVAQLLYAPHTAGGYLVAVIAPVTLAWGLESAIVELRRWAAARRGVALDEIPILTGILRIAVAVPMSIVGLVIVVSRLCFDREGIWAGVRAWVLDTAPPAHRRSSLAREAFSSSSRPCPACQTRRGPGAGRGDR